MTKRSCWPRPATGATRARNTVAEQWHCSQRQKMLLAQPPEKCTARPRRGDPERSWAPPSELTAGSDVATLNARRRSSPTTALHHACVYLQRCTSGVHCELVMRESRARGAEPSPGGGWTRERARRRPASTCGHAEQRARLRQSRARGCKRGGPREQ